MKPTRLLLTLLAGLLAAVVPARAQIAVSLSIKERLHIRHEAILATVAVTNNTGRDITLEDTRQSQWFGFQISVTGDRFIAPRDLHYRLEPLPMRAGETLKRTVNLNDLYPLGEYGTYAIRANIYFAGMDRYFSSKPTHVEITDGRVIWRRSAGVPEGEAEHLSQVLLQGPGLQKGTDRAGQSCRSHGLQVGCLPAQHTTLYR